MDTFLKLLRKATALCLAIAFILIIPVPSMMEAEASAEETVAVTEPTEPEVTVAPEDKEDGETSSGATSEDDSTPADSTPPGTSNDPAQEPSEPQQEPETDTEEKEKIPEETQPENKDIRNNVPRMFQTDYPDTPYGDGTLYTSGCSMTCMAMVVSYLTGQTVTPDNLAARFRNADGSHIQRMEAIATIYDIKYTKTFAMYDVINALKEGKLVVEMVASPSPFTSGQHLILLTGISGDGKIFVNDPLGTNYLNPKLAYGLTYGFDTGVLSYGFSGAWIFEPEVFPEDTRSQYEGLTLTAEEKDLLARMVWLEARGEPFKGQQAVAEVVLNRLVSNSFPGRTLRAVIFAEDQFTTTKFLADTIPDELQLKAVERALTGPNVIPLDVYFFARAAVNRNTWGRIGGHTFCYSF